MILVWLYYYVMKSFFPEQFDKMKNWLREHKKLSWCIFVLILVGGAVIFSGNVKAGWNNLFSDNTKKTESGTTTPISTEKCPEKYIALLKNNEISGGGIGISVDVCSEAEAEQYSRLCLDSNNIHDNGENIKFNVVSCKL